jgi:protein involved in polysaccharide export with SLBB domain
MYRKAAKLCAIFVVSLQIGGCITDYGPVASDSTPMAPSHVASGLQSGDQLKIIVYGEDSLSGIYDVSPAGIITMPLVGPITAGGHTTSEVARALTRAYANGKFLQDPKISVSVVSYRPFFVLGEVFTPGRYTYTSGLDVLGAVATAGGFTYRASRTLVLIRHDGQQVWQEYSLATPVPIEPGDLIRVPERYF